MPEQFGDKTHDATPFRRQKARDDGHVPKSNDLVSAIMLLAGLLALMYAGRSLAEWLGGYMAQQLAHPPELQADTYLATTHWAIVALGLAKTLLPVLLVLVVVAVVANLGQIGVLFLPSKVALNPDHINPLKGLQRLFSMNSAMRLTLGIFKILVVAAVAAWSLWLERFAILGLAEMEVPQIAYFIGNTIFWTIFKVGIALLLLAILDFAYQRWKYEQDLRMTSQEMKEEIKTLQGDPQVLARRRQVQRQLAASRMGQAVPEADVVVTNPTELAVAIKYDYESMSAPVVVAKGAGHVAQRIRRMALENDIPIIERKELARFLYKHVEINHPVPAEQYAAVAEVLKYVYELKGKSLPAA